MKIWTSFLLVTLLAMLPFQAIASDTADKTFCAQAIGYKSLNELKIDLLTNVKRLAVNELFGELITASTAVENFVVTSDQIRASSLGLVRIEGNVNYFNGENLAEVCATIHAYTTEQDRKKFNLVKLTKRHCVTNAGLTTRELIDFAKEEVIIQSLLDYERKLENQTRNKLLRLMQRVNYLESGFISDTETYCVQVEGYIVPIELTALLEKKELTLESFRQVNPGEPPLCGPSSPDAVPLKDDKGLYNLALLKQAVATASSLIPGYPDRHQINYLNDGWYNNCRSWIPDKMPAWIEIDLGEEFVVEKIAFGSEHTAYYRDRGTTHFSIKLATQSEYPNHWYEVLLYNKPDVPIQDTTIFEFEPTQTQYVRIEFYASTRDVRIDEIEIYSSR